MDVFVIGGGASGMLSAISAAAEGACVTIFEKNEKLGKKIYITGKGRCNVTNDCTPDEFKANVVSNNRFLYSSYSAFSTSDMQQLLAENGLKLKVERGKRVFPESDKASDVTKTLTNILKKLDVNIRLNSEVKDILTRDGAVCGIVLKNGEKCHADKVIIATGGLSYPTTGSTGDGYKWAKSLGHEIVKTGASLVPMTAHLPKGNIKDMAGLSLKNVRATLLNGDEKVADDFGEMLFTHEGVSGPIILTLSAYASRYVKEKPDANFRIYIDYKTALGEAELDLRLLREFEKAKNKSIKNVMHLLLPESAIAPVLVQSNIDENKPIHDITKEERLSIAKTLKKFELIVTGLGGYNEAVITSGGVCVKEINPKTMESKLVRGLFFAGEVIDVDALTGGFNLQIAWSTGYAAGKGATYE